MRLLVQIDRKGALESLTLRVWLSCVITIFSVATVRAQTLTTLYSFQGGSDGAYPGGDLAVSGSTLYGMTDIGGINNNGTIFSVNTDGSNYQQLIAFTGASGEYVGYRPTYNGLIVSGSTVYGTTYLGGSNTQGNVFSVNTDGTNFQNLLTFNSTTNGADPWGHLTLIGSSLYGITAGGNYGVGSIFSIQTNGSGYQDVLDSARLSWFPYANSLTNVGGVLYGMTAGVVGGEGIVPSPDGTIFRINPDGSDYTVLASFTGTDGDFPGNEPRGALISEGSTLYGTTEEGGANDAGEIFSINTDGSDFKVLYSFSEDYPWSTLTLFGSTLYGTTTSGGDGYGSIFSINTDGTNFQTLFAFNGTNGEAPLAGLTLVGITLYGTTDQGGEYNDGTVFSFATPEPPSLVLAAIALAILATGASIKRVRQTMKSNRYQSALTAH
jgi:uncharacterized repeat protein (TIGR03803 family)